MSRRLRLWHAVIHPITGYFRRRRGRMLAERFPGLHGMRVLDVGGSEHFWDKLGLDIARERIVLLNVSTTETQGVAAGGQRRSPLVLFDGVRMPFADRAFDLAMCNSVLEHVRPEVRRALAAEMRRVARALFVQTPAYEFPIEPHFLLPAVHWLPKRLGYWLVLVSPWRLLSRPDPDTIRSYHWETNLLRRAEMRELFGEAALVAERALGLTKSHVAIVQQSAPGAERGAQAFRAAGAGP